MSVLHVKPSPPHVPLRRIDLLAIRLTWTQMLAVTALFTGALLAGTGGQVVPFVGWFGILWGWPWLYGSIMAASGVGILLFPGYRLVTIVSSTAACAMYFVLALGFFVLWLEWSGDSLDSTPALLPYPAAAYTGLAALHFLHAAVEFRLWRIDKRMAVN